MCHYVSFCPFEDAFPLLHELISFFLGEVVVSRDSLLSSGVFAVRGIHKQDFQGVNKNTRHS